MHRSTGDSLTLTQKCVKTNRLIGFHTRTLPWKSHTTSECDPAGTRPAQPSLSVVDYRKGPVAGWLAGFTICRLWPTSLSLANPFVPAISEYLTTSNPLCCFISALDFIASARLPGDTLHSPHQLVWDVHWISNEGMLWSDHLKCFFFLSGQTIYLFLFLEMYVELSSSVYPSIARSQWKSCCWTIRSNGLKFFWKVINWFFFPPLKLSEALQVHLALIYRRFSTLHYLFIFLAYIF